MAKKKGRTVWLQSDKTVFDNMINTILTLLITIRKGWTSRQQEIIKLRRKNLTYKEIGKRKEISKQAVSIILPLDTVSLSKLTIKKIKFWFNERNIFYPFPHKIFLRTQKHLLGFGVDRLRLE